MSVVNMDPVSERAHITLQRPACFIIRLTKAALRPLMSVTGWVSHLRIRSEWGVMWWSFTIGQSSSSAGRSTTVFNYHISSDGDRGVCLPQVQNVTGLYLRQTDNLYFLIISMLIVSSRLERLDHLPTKTMTLLLCFIWWFFTWVAAHKEAGTRGD